MGLENTCGESENLKVSMRYPASIQDTKSVDDFDPLRELRLLKIALMFQPPNHARTEKVA
jgi:hypothetical protein